MKGISVIIPTRNRWETLKRCIQSILSSEMPEGVEIIVVDDCSEKEDPISVENLGKEKGIRIRLIRNKEWMGPGASRNIGASIASGEILAFTEDDVRVEKFWLKNALVYFQEKVVHALEGLTLYEGMKIPIRKFEEKNTLSFVACNFFVRKEVFDRLNGYSTLYFDRDSGTYFREDMEFGFRLLENGFNIRLAEDVIVYHPLQHRTIKAQYFHAKRFYFDPLLHKDHRVLFRRMVERKKFGPFRFSRPLHKISLLNVVAIAGALSTVKIEYPLFPLFLILYISSLALIAYKYSTPAFKVLGFVKRLFSSIPYPFYYLFWFIRGCISFKNWRCFV